MGGDDQTALYWNIEPLTHHNAQEVSRHSKNIKKAGLWFARASNYSRG
ncbi:hypothetical protein M7I_4251 [Glarea lozoyensis 74030]|uniref:Uncharacterized protein n=1 Tax=Glarea lozoyensis (strain ATCC 74030 / MF5533) TaxID=1104152 RepID=H0ENP0_GLAL7|nr:hypothetical protein M7I_4251 [Glarea lozoyensis 74030]